MPPKYNRKNISQETSSLLTKCASNISDKFWKQFFEELSIGKCSGNVCIDKNTLYCSNKKVSMVIQNNKSIQELTNDIYKFITTNTEISSNEDNAKKLKEIETQKKTKYLSIKNKNNKDIMIINYVINMRTKYKMNWKNTSSLLSLINDGFLYKIQTLDDIKYKDGNILKINGIKYNKLTGQFENEYLESCIKTSKEKNILLSSDGWVRYYKKMIKTIW